MRRLVLALALLALLLLMAAPAAAQIISTGAISTTATDYQLVAGVRSCMGVAAGLQLVPTQEAAGNWSFSNATTGTANYECEFIFPTRTTAGKGVQVTGLSIVYRIAGGALTSFSLTGVSTTTYANNVANTVASYGGAVTCALQTAVQTNPYVTACSGFTPAFMNTVAAKIVIDVQAVLGAAPTLFFYGMVLTYTEVPI